MPSPLKFNYLTWHGAKHVWANPKQDDQSIQKAAKISRIGGVRNTITIQYRTIELPEKGHRFHVYQIGQLTPGFLGLFPDENRWIRCDDIMERSQMIINIFTIDGIMIPNVKAWYRWTDRRNLIFAVREVKSVPWDLDKEDLYFRFYSGAYFNVLRRNLKKDFIKVKGYVIQDKTEVSELRDFKDKYISDRGHLFIYVNGVFRNDITVDDLTIGNTVEMVYDSTVYKKVSLKLTDLSTFDSLLDQKRKYLLTYDSNVNNTIDYHDDIDFFIVRHKEDVLTRRYGVYYHRVKSDSVRQITHRDYSLVVPYVVGFMDHSNQHEERDGKKIFLNDQDVYIDYFVRRGMLDRPLIYNSHKLHELFKLPFEYRRNAMLGVRSNVNAWRADVLEQGDYTKLISSPDVVYDANIVENAYGYHSISQLTGYSPDIEKDIYQQGSSRKVILRENLRQISSHWEYDEHGVLIDFYNTELSTDYEIQHHETKLIEHLSGRATEEVGSIYNPVDITIPYNEEFRLYRCKKGLELKPDAWVDITDNEDNLFRVNTDSQGNKTIEWLVNNDNHTTLLRKDDQVLAYLFEKPLDNGIIDLYLTEVVTSGQTKKRMRMLVHRGHLDIYLNGHALVRNIDYFVDFPRVVIVCKEYLDAVETGKKQKIVVRHHGFCNKDLSLQNPEQTGYVQFNRLSYNKRYDLKDDKVLNIIIGGAVYDRSVIGFSEEGTTLKIEDRKFAEIEGKPYQIKDLIVPMRGLTAKDTYTLRRESVEVEQSISDYMTLFKPEPRDPNLPPIKALYPLYSPFLSWILDDIRKGTFVFPKLDSIYADKDVLEACKKYEWLLKVDPVYQNQCIDYEYVIIHPHPHYKVIDIDILQYKLLSKITKLYLKGKVILSHFIRER